MLLSALPFKSHIKCKVEYQIYPLPETDKSEAAKKLFSSAAQINCDGYSIRQNITVFNFPLLHETEVGQTGDQLTAT